MDLNETPTARAWDESDVCAYLNISPRQLASLCDEPDFPKPQLLPGVRSGRRWAPDTIPAWIADPQRRASAERSGSCRGTDIRV
jgi:hypothetical protein